MLQSLVVIWFRTLLYTYSQKVWAENSVLFESSRGLNFLITTDHLYHNYVSLATLRVHLFFNEKYS